MKKQRSLYAMIALASVLSQGSCTTAGSTQLSKHDQQSISQVITKGKTTKADIQRQLGGADDTSFTDSGLEIWKYQYARGTPKAKNFIPFVGIFSSGADVKTKELVILFDANGVVSNYTMTESEKEVNQGLLH